MGGLDLNRRNVGLWGKQWQFPPFRSKLKQAAAEDKPPAKTVTHPGQLGNGFHLPQIAGNAGCGKKQPSQGHGSRRLAVLKNSD